MFGKLKKVTIQMVAGANIATILLMFLIGFSDRVNPVNFPVLSNIGLSFPVFILINLTFLFFWLLFQRRKVWIPIVGFLICYVPVREYAPLNIKHEVPKGAIRVMSYNVFLFAGWNSPGTSNGILQYIKKQHPDILCLQEAGCQEIGQANIDSVLDKIYPYKQYSHHSSSNSETIALYSKFPIVDSVRINYPSKGNFSVAYRVTIDEDSVWIINNHLETTGLSQDERKGFKLMMKGEMDHHVAKSTSKLIITRLGESSAKRAVEADAVSEFIEHHQHESIILCGDFNDGPISYTHHTIVKKLIDCYIESGFGPGISYHKGGFFVRIDNIMCTSDWEPFQCNVDNKIKLSDHYPISCWLKKRPKP